MFSAIGEVLGSVFGTQKAIENLTDKDSGLLVKVGGFFNDLHYSDQEIARDKASTDKETREWAIRQLDALQPFKVVQRILAISATVFWILGGLNMFAAIWVDWAFDTELSPVMATFVLSDYVIYPVMSVFTLYISGGVIESAKRKKL